MSPLLNVLYRCAIELVWILVYGIVNANNSVKNEDCVQTYNLLQTTMQYTSYTSSSE